MGATPYRAECVAGADVLIVRELLGGLYYGHPRGVSREAGHNTMRYTRDEIARVAHVAFDQARSRRRKLTSVDKANVLETSQLWRETVIEIAAAYPDVHRTHACRRVRDETRARTYRFDVVVTENLFGDILSDQAAALAGSIGMLPSRRSAAAWLARARARLRAGYRRHGPRNPFGAIASTALLLRHTARLFEKHASSKRRSAPCSTPDIVRPNLPGAAVGSPRLGELGDAVLHELVELIDHQHAYHAI